MARLDRKGGVTASGRSGSRLKLALLGLVLPGAVLGMLNMAPASLHLELHSDTSRMELREQTEGKPKPGGGGQGSSQKQLHEEGADLRGGGLGDPDATSTQVIEHSFSAPDGTDADNSLDAQQREEAARAEAEAAQKAAEAAAADVINTSGGKYHVICSLGSGVYTQWQSRVSYYWYKKTKEACEAAGPCAMGGYTRLLHSGEADPFMDEIPTVVVKPLPAEYQKIAAGYVVLDRPYAFKQWVDQYLDKIEEDYIWMGEPDHIFLRPPPLWATPERPAAFPFFYIEPVKMKSIIDRFNPKGVAIDQFDTIGNSPVQIHKKQFAALSDAWFKLSIEIKNDTEADREFGWVQEMYAYSIAAATTLDQPVRHQLHVEMQLQPPWDTSLKSENGKDGLMIHFTYGDDFNEQGVFTPGKVGHWHWDKRDWTGRYPPRNFPLPPEGCTNEAVKELVRRVNEAADNLDLWDDMAGQLQTPVAAATQRRRRSLQQQQRQHDRQSLGTRPPPSAAAVTATAADAP